MAAVAASVVLGTPQPVKHAPLAHRALKGEVVHGWSATCVDLKVKVAEGSATFPCSVPLVQRSADGCATCPVQVAANDSELEREVRVQILRADERRVRHDVNRANGRVTAGSPVVNTTPLSALVSARTTACVVQPSPLPNLVGQPSQSWTAGMRTLAMAPPVSATDQGTASQRLWSFAPNSWLPGSC